jgi:hypothetical protein
MLCAALFPRNIPDGGFRPIVGGWKFFLRERCHSILATEFSTAKGALETVINERYEEFESND